MNEFVADVSVPVEYSRDKWVMDRVPWALWFAVAGLAVILHVDGPMAGSAALALVYLALLAVAFAGWAATTLVERSGYPFWAILPVILLIAFLVVLVIALFGSLGRSYGPGRLWWSQLVDPPLSVFGWMLMYLGCGWVAYALFRHAYPGQAIIMLSPAGLMFHRSWLRDLFIPWRDIQAVGSLEVPNAFGSPSRNPHAPVVVVRQDFFDDHVSPKLSSFAPPGTERMFWPKGDMMQIVLSSPELIVRPTSLREPIEARWKAFRDDPAAVPQDASATEARIVHGRWAMDGSWRQKIQFLAPLAGAIAVVVHAIWLS